MQEYDLIIIGGGAGAFGAAIKANELGANTLLVNKGLPLGGTCVNVGCVPSKRLLRAGEILHLAKHHGIQGIELEVKDFDFAKVVQDELELVSDLRQGKYEDVLKSASYVKHVDGAAKFIADDQIEVDGKSYRAKKFVITAGSTANVPPVEGLPKAGYMTHIQALKLHQRPKSLVIIGAGPQGLEFGQMFARFGTKVTILQRANSIMPKAEPELAARLSEILANEDIDIQTNVEVKSVRKEGNQKAVAYSKEGKIHEIVGQEILLAAGKTANTAGLDLNRAGVEVDDHYSIKVNQSLQTANSNVFAAGDVNNLPLRQEPNAGREGTYAAENALTGSQKSIDYNVVPYTIFTDPQLAGVGFTEDEQMKQMGVCDCRTISFKQVPRALIMNRTEGLIKMAIHPETKQIMGVHILAPDAGELIAQAMTLIQNKNTIDDVVDSLPMFPTLSEAIKLVALSFTKDISKLSCCI